MNNIAVGIGLGVMAAFLVIGLAATIAIAPRIGSEALTGWIGFAACAVLLGGILGALSNIQ